MVLRSYASNGNRERLMSAAAAVCVWLRIQNDAALDLEVVSNEDARHPGTLQIRTKNNSDKEEAEEEEEDEEEAEEEEQEY